MLHPHGPIPTSRRETCRACKGSGVAHDGTDLVVCPYCGGTGFEDMPERPDALTVVAGALGWCVAIVAAHGLVALGGAL